MTRPGDELVGILGAEAAELRRLLPLLDREALALTRGDAREVAALLPDKEACAQALAGLERTRRDTVERLADTLGRPGVTMADLAPHVADPAALASLRRDLRGLSVSARARNRRNGFLAQRALGIVRGLLAEILAVMAPGPIYAESGRTGPATPAISVLDRRA